MPQQNCAKSKIPIHFVTPLENKIRSLPSRLVLLCKIQSSSITKLCTISQHETTPNTSKKQPQHPRTNPTQLQTNFKRCHFSPAVPQSQRRTPSVTTPSSTAWTAWNPRSKKAWTPWARSWTSPTTAFEHSNSTTSTCSRRWTTSVRI